MDLNQVYLGNTILNYIIFFGIVVGSLLLGRIVYWVSKEILRHHASKTKSQLDDIILGAIEKPLVFLIFIIGLSTGLNLLTLSDSFDKFASNVIQILITIDVFWFIIHFVDAILVHYIVPLSSKSKSKLDDILLPILRRLVRVVLVIFAIVVIVDNFGYDITSLLAGLGIGGLAFALAAKDMLANLFGGASIIMDKPFKLGDRVKVEGYDGYVSEIGLRTTRLKTLDGFLLIVPNSKMADSVLENVSAETTRKVKMTIGVEYGTSQKKMEQAKKILEGIIKDNKDTDDKSIVTFNEFGASSLNFLIIYWIKDLDNILQVKHAINMEIKKQFEKAKIEMAFPTQTIHIKK